MAYQSDGQVKPKVLEFLAFVAGSDKGSRSLGVTRRAFAAFPKFSGYC